MKIAVIILTYNRPKIAGACISTLFNNTKIPISESWIIDDGSDKEFQKSLLQFSHDYSRTESPINLIMGGKNYGVGYNFERAYNIMRQSEDIDIFCFIESDYIWRKGWLEDVVAVFEASPHTISIAGTDHPDMDDKSKTHGEFCKLMENQFGEDLKSRDYLYKPFELKTLRGQILVEGVSNSCGCQIIHWSRLKQILRDGDQNDHDDYTTFNYWAYMDRAFHKDNTGDRRYASDAHMSGTLTMYAERYMRCNFIPFTKNFGMLNICDYSISSHRCAGGINGIIPGMQEGDTFIISPSWKDEYLHIDPRKS